MARRDDDREDDFEGDELDEEGFGDGEETWTDSLQDQFGQAPWWVVSFVVHVLLLLLAMVIVISRLKEKPPSPDIIVAHIAPEEKKEKPKEKTDEHKTEINLKERADKPFYTPEKLPEEEVQTENEEEAEHPARGQQDAVSTIPAEGTGTIGFFGVGGGGRAGAFGWRDGGGRKAAAGKNGGSFGSENAVDRALKWLRDHQGTDGKWDTEKCANGLPEGHEGKTATADAGVAGLALLAFLGAGHTEKHGMHKKSVVKAVTALIAAQDASGSVGHNTGSESHDGSGYNHAVGGLALAEAFGMAGIKKTKVAAQKALDYSEKMQHKPADGSYSAWRYTENQAPDTSVTGWYVMQYKSAKMAGLRVSPSGFSGAREFIAKVTNLTGTGSDSYGGIGQASYQPGKSPNRTMTAVGMLCRLFMGETPSTPLLQGGARFLDGMRPTWDSNSDVDFYYWYYGTLVQFQVGGDYWQRWNNEMRDMLVERQHPGKDYKKLSGSWDPVGQWSYSGGRPYATAMGALCLEVYYRYLPMYGGGGS